MPKRSNAKGFPLPPLPPVPPQVPIPSIPVIVIPVPDIDQDQLLAWTNFGNMIFAANPYEAGLPAKGTWYPNSPKVFDPPPTTLLVPNGIPGSTADSPYVLHYVGSEMHEKVGQWKFKYAEHYVARAIRVPYMYYKPSTSFPSQGVLVKDYFLIGFEGGMGY